ncbi:E3 ubiquitin-protein ligase UHRF1-like [Portunus trituberculatus]|uniref:E3 ubiquitin-protein ligase UHRF1-like n=1 Tax=Portunus trituberculatus TaxID=210409 RepID=UPI001E1CE598|nr:E3 ubiquitin-protein ligase UHRF1-like [Portunus trituberculatus]
MFAFDYWERFGNAVAGKSPFPAPPKVTPECGLTINKKGPLRCQSSSRFKREEDKNEPVKKRKALGYSIGKEIEALIGKDNQNCRMWDECKTKLPEGQVYLRVTTTYTECCHTVHFLSSVQDKFLCVCCQELVFQPVTTECAHNVCKTCLQRSFKAKVFTCPACRHDLGKDHKLEVNKPLSKCLLALFPGYDASR